MEGCEPPGAFVDAVLREGNELPEGVSVHVKGYDFNEGVNYDALFDSFNSVGLQCKSFADGEHVLNEMIKARIPLNKGDDKKCFIFLAYTSNMVSCGVRETIRFLAEHKLVDVLVSSAGGIEEDFIKCLGPFYVGAYRRWPGESLRQKGINRIGNMLVPNDHYIAFEKWVHPIFDKMLEEQEKNNVSWTPSMLIDYLGKEIDNEQSIYYWCHKNNIPVFCPGITDGSLGDMLFSHTYKHDKSLRVDVVEDVKRINMLAIFAKCTGVVVLGGGIVKHHVFNANLMRNGADFTLVINTGNEFEGSDSGADLDEAVSWGKLKGRSNFIKIHAEASLIFPLLVARTFAKHHHALKS